MYIDKCCKENQNQSPSITGQTTASAESCNICGNSAEINWEERVDFEGDDISCGEFGWIFSKKILEGSDKCLDYRAEYFDTCCKIKSFGIGCDICDTGIDGHFSKIRETETVKFNGDNVSCTEVRNRISTSFHPSNAQCAELKNTHAVTCCFQRCSLCGDSNLDWEAIVFFSGEEIPCYEVDNIFLKEGISFDSSRCEMSQSFYADTCCIRPPEQPCNLCSLNGIDAGMEPISNSKVSYDGELKSCLEVHHSLYSRREQFSKHCTDAQGQLFDQCCEAVSVQTNPNGKADETASSPPTTSSTTQKPTSSFDTWYTPGSDFGLGLSSPASIFSVSVWSFWLSVAVGLIVRC